LLALLLACGLRRHEAVNLRVEHLQRFRQPSSTSDPGSVSGRQSMIGLGLSPS
jgi:hypothetical protein